MNFHFIPSSFPPPLPLVIKAIHTILGVISAAAAAAVGGDGAADVRCSALAAGPHVCGLGERNVAGDGRGERERGVKLGGE